MTSPQISSEVPQQRCLAGEQGGSEGRRSLLVHCLEPRGQDGAAVSFHVSEYAGLTLVATNQSPSPPSICKMVSLASSP